VFVIGLETRVRLTNIQFRGYKRLVDTSCNVDGRTIAFVGPNEAGKSSVLQGLAWLTDENAGSLPGHVRSRGTDVTDATEVVRATFVLDSADLDAVNDLATDRRPRKFVLVRCANGSTRYGTIPSDLRRVSQPFDIATVALERALLVVPDAEDFDELRGLVEQSLETLGELRMGRADDDQSKDFRRLAELLAEPPVASETDGDDEPEQFEADPDCAALVLTALEAGSGEHPYESIRTRLWHRSPDFLLFGEDERVIESAYDLSEAAVRNDPPAGLRNLLQLGGTTTDAIYAAITAQNVTRLKTLLRRTNETLDDRVRPTWRQSELAVQIDTEGTTLQVLIEELEEDGSRVAIQERSDGLKIFVALVCFLAVQNDVDTRPVLLIDEAETHLHYDAQADLLDVLANQIAASQVLYSTHSPGCLPSDLGTGVRFVAPDKVKRDVSVIRGDFWNSTEPGFSSLLFAMGAGAAAFSACRRAVLGEGPTEMILLPTLLRRATKQRTLPYQVAPGLSILRRDEFGGEIATKMSYLVDGDGGGRSLRDQLVTSGVPTENIVSLPAGKTTEDLIDRSSFVSAVSKILEDAGYEGPPMLADQLDSSLAVVAAAEAWCETRKITMPGKVAIASYLIQNPEKRITIPAETRVVLRDLHKDFKRILGC
jgi:energy-coupling factor transporter ATP-binding protein EcfA2